jgi:Rrf2 family protein
MELSAKSRYAAGILMELALLGAEGRLSAAALSDHLGISARFAEQILKPLKRNGLVDSARGAAGGYSLARNAGAISLGDIVRAMEGGINFTVCYGERVNDCPRVDACPSFESWEEIGRDMERVLNALTLDILLRDSHICPGRARDNSAPAP